MKETIAKIHMVVTALAFITILGYTWTEISQTIDRQYRGGQRASYPLNYILEDLAFGFGAASVLLSIYRFTDRK